MIAKLDRLARDVHFLTGLQKSRVNFLAVDNPSANKMMLQILMVFAEHERDMISERTKAGLAAAKARGVQLGKQGKVNAKEAAQQAKALRPVIREIRESGVRTVRGIMEELNTRGIKTNRGGRWHPHTVNVLLKRLPQSSKKGGRGRGFERPVSWLDGLDSRKFIFKSQKSRGLDFLKIPKRTKRALLAFRACSWPLPAASTTDLMAS